MSRIIETNKAPVPVGPYSQAVGAGGFLFLAGQVALDPKTGRLVAGGIEEQTRQALENLKAVLKAAGYALRDVVKVSIFLRDSRDFKKMNDVYRRYFPSEPPARTTVEARMVSDEMLVEIDAIAYKGP